MVGFGFYGCLQTKYHTRQVARYGQKNNVHCNSVPVQTTERGMLTDHTPPHLHLTTSKVMMIVWRLRGNII